MEKVYKKFVSVFYSFIFICSFTTAISSAAEISIFGPQKFIRTTGEPDVYTGNFTGLFTDEVPGGKLIVLNGSQTGENRIEDAISSAEIYVNGEHIFSNSDFNKNIYTLETNVHLAETNSFRIVLESTPDSYITISFIQDIPSPSANITAAPDAIKVNETSTLTWTSSFSNECSIEPGIGSVDCNSSITVSPDATTTYTFTGIGPGGTTTDNVIITHLNTAPVASNQLVYANEDEEIAFTLMASDVDGDPLTYHILSQPSHGLLSGDGPDLTYMPAENYNGNDSFIFKVDDGAEDSISANVSLVIKPVNDPPVISGTPANSINAGEYYSFVPFSEDPDAGDQLRFSIENKPVWASFDSNTGSLTGESGSDDVGDFGNIIISVTDNGNLSDSLPPFNISVISNNTAPIITILEPDGIDDLADTEYTIKWSDDDPDDNASISLYYDTDNAGADGTLIVNGLKEDPDESGDQYLWNTAEIPEGDYYIYVLIDDGVNPIVVNYSQDVLSIGHLTFSEMKLTASDGAVNGRFGASASISGNFAVVGTNTTGYIYVYYNNGTEWIEQAKLIPGGEADGDKIGYSVSISDNYIIGYLPGKPVYVFYNNGTEWIEQAKLTPSDSIEGRSFRGGIDIDGKYIIAGAIFDDVAGTNSGAAYILMRNESGLHEQIKLFANDAAEGQLFGYSNSIDGDFALISSLHGGSTVIDSGAAYIFKRDEAEWIEQAKLLPSDGVSGDWFGYSTDIFGDYAIVGAINADVVGANSGAAYIFKRDGTEWIEQAKLVPSDAASGDSFGVSVAINGNYCIVGAQLNDDAGTNSGSAYIFKREGNEWIELIKLIPTDLAAGDVFGGYVNMSDVYAIVTSVYDDDKGTSSGSAYIYKIPSNTLSPSVVLTSDTDSIKAGELATLTWSSENADTCTIEPEVGSVDPNGSITVSPSETTTYTITAAGPGGVVTDTVTVTVNYPQPTVNISASADTIQAGETTTLSWSSLNADTCKIEPSIGDVALNGTIQVSPSVTTTYIITASNSGESVTASVTVTVKYSPPTVSINASADIIQAGESITLSWSSQYADTCTIEPDIGDVETNGSVSVTPEISTTYIITATGPGGTASGSVSITMTYSVPVIEISADPENISINDSTTLTWNTSYATSVKIDQGIGPVDPDGSITVAPTQDTTYTITAANAQESTIKTITVHVIPFKIAITSPLSNSNISRSDVMVQGTITNPDNLEVGVIVNGVTALVYGDQFVANHVPVEEGANNITATAVTSSDLKVVDLIYINAETSGDYIRLNSDEESGVFPLDITLNVGGTLDFIEEPAVTYTGPGVIDIFIGDEDNEYNASIATEGLYFFTVELEQDGNIYTDTIAILVMDPAVLDALLQAKWNEMKKALIDGDIETAIKYIMIEERDSYEEVFQLYANQIGNVIANAEDIASVKFTSRKAKYILDFTVDENGEQKTYSTYVICYLDRDGIWRVHFF